MSANYMAFSQCNSFGVIGVSRNSRKFGNYIFDELKKKGKKVYPINPHMKEYKGEKCYTSISELPKNIEAIVFVTKPEITNSLLLKVFEKNIENIWLQQGSANERTINICNDKTLNIVIDKCIMMYLEPVKSFHKFHRFIWKIIGKYVD